MSEYPLKIGIFAERKTNINVLSYGTVYKNVGTNFFSHVTMHV